MTMFEHDDALRSSIRRARIEKVDDAKSQQRVDIAGLKNEKPKKIWRPQDFGFSSNPPKDTDGVLIQMGSRSDRTLYLDGGHEKYRPKNTPEGCPTLFNMHGDIIRIFKDSADLVHQKKINVRIGKGYEAGNSGGAKGKAGPDDEKGKDTKAISLVADGDKIVITFQNAKVTWSDGKLLLEVADAKTTIEPGKITHDAPVVLIKSPDINLGDMGGTPIGLCGGGCATKVKAI